MKMGYHTKKFKKGVYGEFSKVVEEWEELLDARLQDGKILELCEIADLYGAIAGYVKGKFNLTMEDVAKMSRMTSEAFEEGERVSVEDVSPSEPVTKPTRKPKLSCGYCQGEGWIGAGTLSSPREACHCCANEE